MLEQLFGKIQNFEFILAFNWTWDTSLLVTKKLLTVVMTEGMYECLVLAIGPCPFTDLQTYGMPSTPFLDDIVSEKVKDFEEHLDILNKIFSILENHGIQVNLAKSKLVCVKAYFMVSCWRKTVTNPLERRTKVIQCLAPPKNDKQIKTLLEWSTSS